MSSFFMNRAALVTNNRTLLFYIYSGEVVNSQAISRAVTSVHFQYH